MAISLSYPPNHRQDSLRGRVAGIVFITVGCTELGGMRSNKHRASKLHSDQAQTSAISSGQCRREIEMGNNFNSNLPFDLIIYCLVRLYYPARDRQLLDYSVAGTSLQCLIVVR